ncbi:MAG: hypothetical protein LBM67_07685 [Lentimicrobiaceae bacterium]|jgi:hypothetical protein|nr:hypothetical protein [Lentimicrobiaceae bacterium]
MGRFTDDPLQQRGKQKTDKSKHKTMIEMKKFTFILAITGMTFLNSCKNREDKVKDVVNEFLTQINDETKTLNNDLMTENFAKFCKEKKYEFFE